VIWNLTKSTILRPEIRYDYNQGEAFEGHHYLVTAGLGLITRW
jgi:hypothetical protein